MVSSGPIPAASTMPSRFAHTWSCGSITPRGSEVEPLVYWMMASIEGSSAGGSYRPSARLSGGMRSGRSATGGSPFRGAMNPASAGSATSRAMSAWRTRLRVCSANAVREASLRGRGSGTTAAPASQIPCRAVTRGRLVGPSRPTWSPGPTPRAWRTAAMARASSWSSAHEILDSGPSSMKVTPWPVSAATSSRGSNTPIPMAASVSGRETSAPLAERETGPLSWRGLRMPIPLMYGPPRAVR